MKFLESIKRVLSNNRGSISFDGVDDFVNFTDAFYTEQFSVAAWISPVSYSTGVKSIFVKRNNVFGTNVGNEWNLIINQDGTLRAQAWNSDATTESLDFQTTAILPTNTWSHVGFVMQSGASGIAKLFVNGVLEASAVKSGTMGNFVSVLQLGARTANNNTRYFEGEIEEACVWNAALSNDAFMLHLYSSRVRGLPLQIQPSNLVIYVPMDDGNDGTSADADRLWNRAGTIHGTGVDGANNTGLTWRASNRLSYSPGPIYQSEGAGSGAINSSANPSLVTVKVVVGNATASTNASQNSTATPSLVTSRFIVGSPSVKFMRSSTATPSLVTVKVIIGNASSLVKAVATPTLITAKFLVNSPTVEIHRSANATPNLVSVRVLINSPIVNTSGSRIAQPSLVTVRIVVNSPAVSTGAGTVSVVILLKSKLETTLNTQSRISKYIDKESEFETTLNLKSKMSE